VATPAAGTPLPVSVGFNTIPARQTSDSFRTSGLPHAGHPKRGPIAAWG
jgi:hypothetical protein